MGKRAISSSSQKQKLNTRSLTEAELVAADDALTSIMWTKLFLKEQGYNPRVILNQDNMSTMQLQKNGKASSHRRTQHIKIRFFMLKDHLDNKEFKLEYCPTDKMHADFMSKPLEGKQFLHNRKNIMGM